jgi:hypothetical protein
MRPWPSGYRGPRGALVYYHEHFEQRRRRPLWTGICWSMPWCGHHSSQLVACRSSKRSSTPRFPRCVAFPGGPQHHRIFALFGGTPCVNRTDMLYRERWGARNDAHSVP